FEEFTIKNRTISLENDMGQAIEYLEALDSQRVSYEVEIDNIETLEKQLLSNNLDIITPFKAISLPDPIKDLVTEYTTLVAERKVLLESYNEVTLVIAQLDYKIKDIREQAKELISEYKGILNKSLLIVDEQKRRINNNFNQLPSRGTEYNKNQRVYGIQEELYLSLRQSKTELEIARAGTVNKSVILSNASFPTKPVHPKHLIIYGIGIVAGIVFSLFFVIVRYLLHDTLSTVKEVEQLINVPILGSIPVYKKGKEEISRMIVDKNPKSSISESFRSIRTNMDFLNSDNSNRLITITSTVGGEGKTFVGVNLAAIIALSGQKVCVVDLDMRKPKVNFAFEDDFNDEKGISTVLIGRYNVTECLKNTRIENLQYLSAGPTPPNPSELLMSNKFDEMVTELKTIYDVIIFDTPPVGLVTDGVLVMKKSDLQIYVIRSDYSKRNYLRTLNDLVGLNKLNNLTVILNSLNNKAGVGGYGYGYGGGYGYYEDETSENKFKSKFKF
ncbi:MAG: polysaccharide biosynthesis tyrosine autokinase, partial [Cyclobacteriaceae bacterium]